MTEIFQFAKSLCIYAGKDQDFLDKFWTELQNSTEIYEEFSYYFLHHDFLCKKAISGLTIVDIFIWQMDHFKSDMDRGYYDMQNNPDNMILMAFDTFLKMEIEPE